MSTLGFSRQVTAAIKFVATLEAYRKTARFERLGRVVGVVPKGQPWHRGYTKPIAKIMAAAAALNKFNGKTKLRFDLIVGANGKPLSGLNKNPVIRFE